MDYSKYDEIDLTKIIINLWNGKLIIISSTLIALLIALGLNLSAPKPNFKAYTKIKPLSSFQAQKYDLLNSYDFFLITPKDFLSLYVENLVYRNDQLVKAIDKIGVFQKSDFKTVKDYNSAILNFISNIEINSLDNNYEISFTYNDAELWKKILYELNANNEEIIRLDIIRKFNKKLLIEKQKKDYLLEDIQVQIENIIADYDKKISNRLAYLNEQKQIARKVGVAKNSIEIESNETENGLVANFITVSPFYLRGYEAIEEEINLIKNRKDKTLFIDGLLELENKKRDLQQNKTLERAENLFKKTPLVTKDNFVAVNLDIEETSFVYKSNKIKISYALFFGILIGVFIVLITNAVKNIIISKTK